MIDLGRMAYSEAEYSVLFNKIELYLSTISECIEEYAAILDHLSSDAIQDEKITAVINQYRVEISNYTKDLENIGLEVASVENVAIDGLTEVGRIKLSNSVVSEFVSILSPFQ